MKRLCTELRRLVGRELTIITHDRSLMMIILLGGLLYPVLYGSFYWHKRERDVPIAVVDQSRTEMSRELIRWLDAHPTLIVKYLLNDESEGRDLIYRMKVQAVVYIPADYEVALKSGTGTTVMVHLDASRFLLANNINIAINEVIGERNIEARNRLFEKAGFGSGQAEGMTEPLRADIRSLFNTMESYGNFLTPALFALILMQTLLVALAESMAKEREAVSLLSLREHAKGSILRMMISKGAIYFLFYAAYALLFFSVLFKIYRLEFKGSASALTVLTVVWLIAVIFWGIFIASFFKKKMSALQVMILTSYPVFFLSGYSWPVYAMPAPLQWLSYLLPGTPYLTAMGRITTMGAGWSQITENLIHLLVLVVTGYLLAVYRLRKLTKYPVPVINSGSER
jgi:ABC-2 type transport system permease protein